jgi:hypothetical protein
LPVRRIIIEQFHSRRSSFHSFRKTGLNMTSDTFGSDEILSPLAGLGSFSNPHPTLTPHKEKAWGSDGAKIVTACAGINRHGVADERAVQERSSEPS